MEETGEYAFLFRNYNPELAPWSSEDPSGFPDGANNLAYAPNPIFDITLWTYISGAPEGLDHTFNCHGYLFGNSQFWINSTQVSKILQGDGYFKITGEDQSKAKIAIWDSDGGHSAKVIGYQGQTVGLVQGKLGAVPRDSELSVSFPSNQRGGAPVYYE